MKVYILLFIVLGILCPAILACGHDEKIVSADDLYSNGVARDIYPFTVSEEQNRIDHHWMEICHKFAVEKNPNSPFCAALVYAPNNTLVALESNMVRLNDPRWSRFWSHAEMIAMVKASEPDGALPDSNPTGTGLVSHPMWKDITMYGNIEMCPMCTGTAVYRKIARYVYGARAMQLQVQRCWTQSNLTSQEMYDNVAHYHKQTYGRGPLSMESTILNDFPTRCASTTTPTPTPTLAPTSKPTSPPTSKPTPKPPTIKPTRRPVDN